MLSLQKNKFSVKVSPILRNLRYIKLNVTISNATYYKIIIFLLLKVYLSSFRSFSITKKKLLT